MANADSSVSTGEGGEAPIRDRYWLRMNVLHPGPGRRPPQFITHPEPGLRLGCPGPLAEDPSHLGKQVFGRQGSTHPVGEAREDFVGRGPIPVDDPVRQAPGPLPERLKGQRDDRGGHEAEHHVLLGPAEGPDPEGPRHSCS